MTLYYGNLVITVASNLITLYKTTQVVIQVYFLQSNNYCFLKSNTVRSDNLR